MKVTVKKCDIEKANRIREKTDDSPALAIRYPRNKCCPIAQAIRRQTKKAVKVRINDAEVAGVRYDLPRIAKDFIVRFDNDYVVKPFSFELTR